MAEGLPPKWRFQKPSLNTTTSGDWGRQSRNARPIAGWTPTTSKRFALTTFPRATTTSSLVPIGRSRLANAAIDSKLRFCACQSMNAGYETPSNCSDRRASVAKIMISCDGSASGNGRSRTALTMLKIALVAPTPSAKVTTAVAVKARFRRSTRTA
jgi:hypothetical protein